MTNTETFHLREDLNKLASMCSEMAENCNKLLDISIRQAERISALEKTVKAIGDDVITMQEGV